MKAPRREQWLENVREDYYNHSWPGTNHRDEFRTKKENWGW